MRERRLSRVCRVSGFGLNRAKKRILASVSGV
jgi:hypothetical protein